MFRRHRHRVKPDRVEPDLPIVPMLDMSFQLLAFFVMTFNPVPAEGHLDMALPLIEGGKSEAPPPPSLEDAPDELFVIVEADAAHQIAQIRIREKDDTSKGRPLGADSAQLREALLERKKKRNGQTAKVKLEIDKGLAYAFVVKLIDEIKRTGYPQVAPALLGPDPPRK